MSTRPSPPASSSSDPPSPKIGEVIYYSLETALTKQCEQRYNTDITVRCLEISAEDTLKMRLRVDCRGLTQMPLQIVLTHSGGNVYDALCTVVDGDSHRFSYSLPGQAGTKLSYAPYLGRELAAFLREELEKRLGRLLLQSPARPPKQTRSILP